MCDTCDDSRFELIEKYKQRLLDATNIGDSPEEMAVIDNILVRFWQMGWLDRLELFGNSEQLDCSDCVDHGGDWECDHVQCRKGTDTISRQAAVSGISDLLMLELKGERLPTYNEVYRAIYDLPSAGLVAKDICVPVKDCISRQAAIDALENTKEVAR